MADLTKLKRKNLGAPPPPEEASDNLAAPETAPPTPHLEPKREDMRSARRTGRTVQFATRVTVDFDRRFRSVAKREKLLLAELLERALEAYQKDSR